MSDWVQAKTVRGAGRMARREAEPVRGASRIAGREAGLARGKGRMVPDGQLGGGRVRAMTAEADGCAGNA